MAGVEQIGYTSDEQPRPFVQQAQADGEPRHSLQLRLFFHNADKKQAATTAGKGTRPAATGEVNPEAVLASLLANMFS